MIEQSTTKMLTTTRAAALPLLMLCLAAIAASGGRTADQTAPPVTLHLIAVGDVPTIRVTELAAHFQRRFGLTVETLLPLGFDEATFDRERSQIVADRVIQAIRFRHPTLAKNSRTRIIGITSLDMYMEAMRAEWSFTFSLRSRDQRMAVVSYARMDPANLGDPPDDQLLMTRLRKMIAKNVGIIVYGLPPSRNPRSVLYGNILGVDDLDRMTEEFDPR